MIQKWRVKLLNWLLWEMRERINNSESNTHTLIQQLEARIKDLEEAYAQDPRRAEIAKEKAEAPQVMGGFVPRSKRIRAWEEQRRAQPKE